MSVAEPPSRENTGCALGITAGLLVVLAAVASLFAVRGGSVDGAEIIAATFRDAKPPFGVALEEAARLPSGEVVCRLGRPTGGGPEPDELVLVEYPSMDGLATLFPPADDEEDDDEGPNTEASEKKLRWDEDPSFAFTADVEAGRIAWERWQADFVVVRAYLEGGSWRESARVNLGQEGRALALFVRWPPETLHSQADLQRVLRSIEMLAPGEDQG